MQKLSRLFKAGIVTAITIPILNACASPATSGPRKVQSKMLPGTNQHRIVTVPRSGINAGPENIINPPRQTSGSVKSSPASLTHSNENP